MIKFMKFCDKFKEELHNYGKNEKIQSEYENCKIMKAQYIKIFDQNLIFLECIFKDSYNSLIDTFFKLFLF